MQEKYMAPHPQYNPCIKTYVFARIVWQSNHHILMIGCNSAGSGPDMSHLGFDIWETVHIRWIDCLVVTHGETPGQNYPCKGKK